MFQKSGGRYTHYLASWEYESGTCYNPLYTYNHKHSWVNLKCEYNTIWKWNHKSETKVYCYSPVVVQCFMTTVAVCTISWALNNSGLIVWLLQSIVVKNLAKSVIAKTKWHVLPWNGVNHTVFDTLRPLWPLHVTWTGETYHTWLWVAPRGKLRHTTKDVHRCAFQEAAVMDRAHENTTVIDTLSQLC